MPFSHEDGKLSGKQEDISGNVTVSKEKTRK
jgi:hypothetical protein